MRFAKYLAVSDVMRSAGCWIAMVVLAASLVLSGPAWAADTKATGAADDTAASPKLRCDEPIHDFGEVWMGTLVEHAYIIHNDGKAPLEILNVRAGCGCTATEYDKVIAPGGTGKVTAKLNTNRMIRPVSKTVAVTSNDPDTPSLVLTIKGVPKPPLTVEPMAGANFGTVTEEETELVRKISVVNNTDGTMKLTPVELVRPADNPFAAEVNELKPGKEAEVVVTAKRPFRHGSNSAQFQFTTGVEKQPQISISARLYSPPRLQVRPSSLPIYVPVTGTSPRTVRVQYNGKGEMKIESHETGNEAISVRTRTLQEGREFEVTITVRQGFDPASEELVNVVLNTNLESDPKITIPLRIVRRQTPARKPDIDETVTAPPSPAASAESLIGKPLPVVKLTAADGRPIEMKAVNGQVTLINFWASWSEASRRQLPLVQRIGNMYARRGVRLVNVSMDYIRPRESTVEAAAKLGAAKSSLAVDLQRFAAVATGVKNPPTLFVVGKTGNVEAVHKGIGAEFEDLKAYEEVVRTELDLLLDDQSRAAFPKQTLELGPVDSADGREAPGTGDAAAPRLAVESLRLDTGLHQPGSKMTCAVYCRNEGMRPLSITAVTPGDGLVVKPDYAKVLQPAAVSPIVCEFTAPKTPGDFAMDLTIESDDPSRPKVEMKLTGATQPYLEVDPMTGIDFSDRTRTFSMGRMATILYHGQGAVNYLSAESSSPKFEAAVRPIRDTGNAMITVQAKPPFEVGTHQAVITVKTDCKEQPSVEVPVQLVQPKPVEIYPEVVQLGNNRQLQRHTVKIANNTNTSLHVLGVESSNKRIRSQFYPEPDGYSYKLELMFPARFLCAPEGEKFTIRTDHPEYGEIVIPVKPQEAGK